MLVLAVALSGLLLFIDNAQAQTFTNDCLSSTVDVRYYYSTAPCQWQGANTFNAASVAAGTNVTFPAPPAGTFYFACRATINTGTCNQAWMFVQFNTGGNCNGPTSNSQSCTGPVGSADLWIENNPLFDVTCDGV